MCEGAFKQLKGVHSALPGYAGGDDPSPTYESVCRGKTGHAEVVEVMFDAEQISYSTLLEVFFTVHDPTQLNRQGNDMAHNTGVPFTPHLHPKMRLLERLQNKCKRIGKQSSQKLHHYQIIMKQNHIIMITMQEIPTKGNKLYGCGRSKTA